MPCYEFKLETPKKCLSDGKHQIAIRGIRRVASRSLYKNWAPFRFKSSGAISVKERTKNRNSYVYTLVQAQEKNEYINTLV